MRRELTIPLVVLIVAACNGASRTSSTEPAEPAESVKAAEARGQADATFELEVSPPASCAAGTTCEAKIVLTALGDYKVNKDYPFKFVADPGSAELEGTGTFTPDAPKSGTMTVKLRAGAPGTAHVKGKFKLSVCTDEVCKIESPNVAFDVPVT